MAEPNPFINQAVSLGRAQEAEAPLQIQVLNQAAATAWGQAILRHNPDFKAESNALDCWRAMSQLKSVCKLLRTLKPCTLL